MKDRTTYYYCHFPEYKMYFKRDVCFVNKALSFKIIRCGSDLTHVWFTDDENFAIEPNDYKVKNSIALIPEKLYFNFSLDWCVDEQGNKYKIILFNA